MLSSRIFSHYKAISRSQALTYCFSFFKKSQSTPLRTQIISATTFSEFYKIYKQNQAKFTSDTILFATRTIAKLLSNKEEERISFIDMDNIMKGIVKIDVQTLTASNITTILSIYRQFKRKRFNHSQHYPFRDKIAKRYISLLKQTSITPQSIQQILYSYYQFTLIYNYDACRSISDKIIAYIQEPKQNNQNIFNEKQIMFLMKCLSKSQELDKSEIQIRSYLLEQIKKDISRISMNNLIQLCISLNYMDLFDISQDDAEVLRDITNHILEKISTIEYSQILKFVKGQSVSKYPGFMRIYEKIMNNIFAQIDSKGHSKLNSDIILRIFSFLSSRLSLRNVQQQNQHKFFAYLEDQIGNKYLNSILFELIEKDFFSNKKQKDKLQSILKAHDFQVSLKLMYFMSLKNYDMTQFAQRITNLTTDGIFRGDLYKIIIILDRLKKNNTVMANILTPLVEKVSLNYKTPESFVEFYKLLRLEREYVSLYHLNEVFHEYFTRLPNPFQSHLNNIDYKFFYLDYILHCFNSKDFVFFLQNNNASIRLEEVINLISVYLRENTKYLQSEKPLIFLLNSRISEIMQSKNKQYIKVVLTFLSKYNRLAVYQMLNSQQQHQLFQLIFRVIQNASILKQTKQIFNLAIILDKYLTRYHRNYNLEFSYRHLLQHIINHISQFTGNMFLIHSVVEHSIRLNTLSATILQNINLTKLFYISSFLKLKAYYIQDPTFCEKLPIITKKSLKVILHNRNYSKFISENEDNIVDVIRNCAIPFLFSYAVYFNQPDSPASTRILTQILNNISQKISTFQARDIIGFFRNAYDRNFYFFDSCKHIAKKIIRFMTTKAPTSSLSTHIEVIKFIITQVEVDANDYFSRLIQVYHKKGEDSYALNCLYYWLSQTSYQFKFEELKMVENMMKKNVHYSLYYFLMLEYKMQPQYRSDIAVKLSQQISKVFNQRKLFMGFDRFKFQYLKSAYPQQTKPLLIIPENELGEFKFSFKPPHLLALLDQIAKITKNQLILINQFGLLNHVLRIKDYVFVFVNNKRIGAYYEQEFIKRAIIQLVDEPVHVICLKRRFNITSTIHHIRKNFQGLLSVQQTDQLLKITKSKNSKPNPLSDEQFHGDSQ